MKTARFTMLAAIACLTVAGRASAGPIAIQIDGSDLNVLGAFGVGDYAYSDETGSIELDEGESQWFNFGHVDILDEEDGCWFFDCATAAGEVEFTVDVSTPILDGIFSDLALFGVISAGNDGVIRLEWGAPTSVGYSYNGASGGILSLDMYDLGSGLFDWDDFDDGFNLWGMITNEQSPGGVPEQSPVGVPEPGILLLLGTGLIAVAVARRGRRAIR